MTPVAFALALSLMTYAVFVALSRAAPRAQAGVRLADQRQRGRRGF
jgi:hypothetical protein